MKSNTKYSDIYTEIISDFQNLINFINDDITFLNNMFVILNKYFEFDTAGIFFNSPDNLETNTLHLYLKNNFANLKTIEHDFFTVMGKNKEIIKSDIKINKSAKNNTKKPQKKANKIILPLMYNNILMGGFCLYSQKNILKTDLDSFNFIINEMLNIYKLKYMFSEQVFKSSIDPLTQLYNRAQFQIGLEHEFNRAERYKSTFSIAMIDIDHFKKINDNYGHQFGDFILKEVSKIIQYTFRKTDLVYRYGGEEIAIIMPETNKDNAYLPLEKLRKKIEKYNFNNKNITVSIGVSEYKNNLDVQKIIKQADNNLYTAKNSGRNIICNN